MHAPSHRAGLPLLQRLANACNDLHAMPQRIGRLLADKLVALVQQAAPLRVPKDDPVDAQVCELLWCDLRMCMQCLQFCRTLYFDQSSLIMKISQVLHPSFPSPEEHHPVPTSPVNAPAPPTQQFCALT